GSDQLYKLAARAKRAEENVAAARTKATAQLEADVEAARAEVFAALNSATALRHAVEHAGLSRERVTGQLSKLDLELAEVTREAERVTGERTAAAQALRRAQQSAEATKLARSARDAELASARIELEWRTQALRTTERELAALSARLGSLEELDSARAGYTEAAKMLLAQANGRVEQMGSVADCLEVEPRYERAVEACLGDLLQHVLVPRTEHALAALQIVSEAKVGRCGLLVVEPSATTDDTAATTPDLPGLRPIESVLRIDGKYSSAIRAAMGEAWIAEDLEPALASAARVRAPIVTLAGEIVRGPHVVSGGLGDETLGILAVKREIKELRERQTREQDGLAHCAAEVSTLETVIAQAVAAVAALNAEQHRQEKTMVGLEFQLQRATEDADRLGKKSGLIDTERHSAEDERHALDARQTEAQSSIARLEQEQRAADERLGQAQRRLLEARETLDELNRQLAEGKAAHAALTERAAGLATDVSRLEEAAAELEARAATCRADAQQAAQQREALEHAILENTQKLDTQLGALDELRAQVRSAEDVVTSRRGDVDQREVAVRQARRRLEEVRASVAALDLDRVTAESHLSHLAASCVDTLQTTLDEVLAEVEQAEASGAAGGILPTAAERSPLEEEGAEDDETLEGSSADQSQGEAGPEEVIAGLRAKLDRLGAVNMMAIEQFDELSTRHTFLSTQRKDLVESIAVTGETIKRIDDTTRQRFRDAFDTINVNFQQTFSTLFGGGRAGLTLLDESDLLETGIEIIAQPPGKRLQSVQLLSGGEKALTAIALMFAIFKYKPRPFCVLDEIDAPLDDANIGRFVEMLKGMLQHTQFILITHNRKTMEIADRLYGVTMEEPGVSKLVSLQLN
ncbi:MAG: chromosome segregation protein SMC, partial [Acidobacteria bacterium]